MLVAHWTRPSKGLDERETMENTVFRDPAVKEYDSFRVMFNDRLCSPSFNSIGAAISYLAMLETNQRKPEYV